MRGETTFSKDIVIHEGIGPNLLTCPLHLLDICKKGSVAIRRSVMHDIVALESKSHGYAEYVPFRPRSHRTKKREKSDKLSLRAIQRGAAQDFYYCRSATVALSKSIHT